MSGLKTQENQQWGRVLADINSAIPSPDNNGREPTLTPEGALWIRGVDNAPPQQPYQTKEYYSSAGLLDQGLITTGECDLLALYGFKSAPAILRYLMLFDALALPADGTTPLITIALQGTPAAGFSISNPVLSVPTRMFSVGIYFASSSMADTLVFNVGTMVSLNAMVGKPFP